MALTRNQRIVLFDWRLTQSQKEDETITPDSIYELMEELFSADDHGKIFCDCRHYVGQGKCRRCQFIGT